MAHQGFFFLLFLFCFLVNAVFFKALQVYIIWWVRATSVLTAGEWAEAAGRFMVLAHNGPLMCFLSLKVQPAAAKFCFPVEKHCILRGDVKHLFCLIHVFVARFDVKAPELWREAPVSN